MNLFSISQLSKYAGIKPHTIRIWEKRYNALEPVRSEGNTRYYDGEQLRRLLNIVSLKQQEPNLSVLCNYSDEELFQKVKDNLLNSGNRGDDTEYYISQFIASGSSYDEHHFNQVFQSVIDNYNVEYAYSKVIYPLLERVGLLWSIDSVTPPVEHFLSNMLRQKFYALINDIPVSKKNKERWILFLREGEYHEMGLLFAQYVLKLSGRRVVYLGADTPLEPLLQSIEIVEPTHLLFFQVAKEEPEELEAYVAELSQKSGKLPILVATGLAAGKSRKNVFYLNSLNDLKKHLKGL